MLALATEHLSACCNVVQTSLRGVFCPAMTGFRMRQAECTLLKVSSLPGRMEGRVKDILQRDTLLFCLHCVASRWRLFSQILDAAVSYPEDKKMGKVQ